jgi:hypothetical protein
MQKVEGSNPFSRSKKACICRSFSFGQSLGSSASGRTDSGLRLDDRRWFQAKRPVCRPIRACPNRCPSAGPQKVKCSDAAAVARFIPQTARSRVRMPADAVQRSRSSWASPVSVRKPRGRPPSRSATDPASQSSQARQRSLQDDVRAAARVPITGPLGARRSHRIIAEASRSSEAGVCVQLGWAPAHRPEEARATGRSRRSRPSKTRSGPRGAGGSQTKRNRARTSGRHARASPAGRPF